MNIRKTATASLNLSAGENSLQIDLGATSSVNIIQSISVTFNTFPLADVTDWNIQTFDGTSTRHLVYSSAGVVSQAFTQLGRNNSIVSTYRYIDLNVTATVGTGNSVIVAVSYLQIPSSNNLSSNFLLSTGTTNTGTTSLLTGPAQGTYIIKSIWVTITDAAAQDVYITLNQSSINAPISASTSISGISGSVSSAPLVSIDDVNLSLGTSTSLSLHQGGTNNLSYYVSYTYNALDI